MSGYKRATISISRDEYDRLREAEQQLRALPAASEQKQAEIAQDSSDFFEATINEMELRQSSLQEMLSGMADYVRDVEENTCQAMVAFESKAMADMEQYAGSLWNYFGDLIDDHSQQYEEMIARNHHQYQQELGLVARQIRRMADSQEQKQRIAEEWLAAAELFAAFIRENYAFQYFAPGRMERLEQQLVQAQQNLAYGLSEATIATSQQLYLAFSDLRVELERMQTEWQVSYSAVREALAQEFHLLEQSRLVQAVDLDGNPLDYLVNVEYWTGERISQLYEMLASMGEGIHDSEHLPDTETLTKWLMVDLPTCHHTLEEIILDARIAALNSQLRINIADLVVRALREQGFSVSNADYESNDMRMGYDMQLYNLEGSEVIVQVTPVGTSIGDNELQISSLDREELTEHELVTRWMEISRSLSTYGLEIGQYASSNPDLTQQGLPVKSGSRPSVSVPVTRSRMKPGGS